MYLSLASFLGLTPTVLLSPFIGVLADRWSRKALIFTSDLLQALATVVLILFFAVGNVQIWQTLSILDSERHTTSLPQSNRLSHHSLSGYQRQTKPYERLELSSLWRSLPHLL